MSMIKFTPWATLAFASIMAGCKTEMPVNMNHSSEWHFGNPTMERYEMNDGNFSLAWSRAGEDPFRLTSFSNVNDNATTEDLQKFGDSIFENVLKPKLNNGQTLTPVEEDLLYFSFDIWVGTMNDITTYSRMSMQSENDYAGLPDDFVNEEEFIDIAPQDMENERKMRSASVREQLRAVRNGCVRNIAGTEVGKAVAAYGKNFHKIPREVFQYQYSTILGEIKKHGQREYLAPRAGNLWGMTSTDDPELSSYSIGEDASADRARTDSKVNESFLGMSKMIDIVGKAIDDTKNVKTKDILDDVKAEFEGKHQEVKLNIDLVLVDLPVSIYAKIALHEIDQAKGVLDDNEDLMEKAIKDFYLRTEQFKLLKRITSDAAKEICIQLYNIGAAELDKAEIVLSFGDAINNLRK